MEITRNDNCSPYGMACTECKDLLIAPEWSEHVSEDHVRHFWSCDNCGHSWATNTGAAQQVHRGV
jgi:hypothetical protein